MVDASGLPSKQGMMKRWVQVPCGRQRCSCVLCRQTHARNESAILAKSFEILPPSHFVVLRHDTCENPAELWACWKRFQKRLKESLPGLSYYVCFEATAGEPPHVHVLVRIAERLVNNITNIMPDLKNRLKTLWRRACRGGAVSVYCRAIRNVQATARYVPKHWLYKEGRHWKYVEPWFPGEEWAGIKLVQSSRGFLAAPRAILWKAVKQDWFPNGEPDYKALPTWELPPVATPSNANRLMKLNGVNDFTNKMPFRIDADNPLAVDLWLQHRSRADWQKQYLNALDALKDNWVMEKPVDREYPAWLTRHEVASNQEKVACRMRQGLDKPPMPSKEFLTELRRC